MTTREFIVSKNVINLLNLLSVFMLKVKMGQYMEYKYRIRIRILKIRYRIG